MLAAKECMWWGYKRIAVMLRMLGVAEASNPKVYRIFKRHGLLRRRRPRAAELHQATKLFELLPQRPNELWQADVTYIEIPGHGWWYAVTVIDYYSRYLLACHLTHSFSAEEVAQGLAQARAEAERLHGAGTKPVTLVTDNGVSFLATKFRACLKSLDIAHVRIRYRTPQQLGLLERFHAVLKGEEVYWNLYANPADCREKLEQFRVRYNTLRPHWALIPEAGGDVVPPDLVYTGAVRTRIPRWQTWAIAAKRKLDEGLAAMAPKPTGSVA